MKRFLALLLILLLPFQTSLAAVMAIEASAAAAEQFHEEAPCHEHLASTAADETPAAPSHGTHDGHGGTCGTCTMSCCSALPVASQFSPVFSARETPVFASSVQPPAPPAARPERPNWARLA